MVMEPTGLAWLPINLFLRAHFPQALLVRAKEQNRLPILNGVLERCWTIKEAEPPKVRESQISEITSVSRVDSCVMSSCPSKLDNTNQCSYKLRCTYHEIKVTLYRVIVVEYKESINHNLAGA